MKKLILPGAGPLCTPGLAGLELSAALWNLTGKSAQAAIQETSEEGEIFVTSVNLVNS